MSLHYKTLRMILKAVSPRARAARMKQFEELMQIQPGQRVIDLGGSTKIWKFIETPLNITVVNLETQRIDEYHYGAHSFTIARGDATNLHEYGDNSFDLVFSNSVIEHVGDATKQAAFAAECRRLAPSYYVQTPAISFPLEAHTGLPFWWYYPEAIKRGIIARWAKQRPSYGEFVKGTRVLRKSALKAMFPDGDFHAERIMGLIKSHIVCRRGTVEKAPTAPVEAQAPTVALAH